MNENERLKNERQNERLKNENERTVFVQCERELKNESRTRGLRTRTRDPICAV